MLETNGHHIPGWNTYPEYTMLCQDCETEFVIAARREEVDVAICTSCSSTNVKLRYISYPTDGPGFQKGYNPDGLIYGGGAAGSSKDTDIAGLPLKIEKIKIKDGKIVTDDDADASSEAAE